MQTIVHLLSVAGSSSQCARCTAMSKRTKEQCGRPALKASKTQKCQFHGGRGWPEDSRGPATGGASPHSAWAGGKCRKSPLTQKRTVASFASHHPHTSEVAADSSTTDTSCSSSVGRIGSSQQSG